MILDVSSVFVGERMGDKVQCLRDDSHLNVYNHVKLRIIATGRGYTPVEGDFELAIEVGLQYDQNQSNTRDKI